jgi:hypothetical protein
MRKNLSDRLAELEIAIAGRQPRYRIVTSETVYADEDDKVAKRKSVAAIDADRKASGWAGEYIVMQPFETHAKDGTWIGRRPSP